MIYDDILSFHAGIAPGERERERERKMPVQY